MVTTARRVARPVSVFILMVFATGPALVMAGPQIDPASAHVSDVSPAPIAAFSKPFATFTWERARPVADPPRWFDTTTSASTPAKSGGWWSRRTTAQKTWIIVGIVAGAVGIYAIATNDSGGGGGGGGY